MDNEHWEYKPKIKAFDFFAPLLLLLVFGGVCLWLYLANNNAYILTLPLAAIAVFVNLATLYSAFFVKFFVGTFGFYHQTKPGNGKYYTYAEIKKAWMSVELNGAGYCNYETVDGNKVKFAIRHFEQDAVECFLLHVNGEGDETEEDKYEDEYENEYEDE